jgi:hypothetical protein
MQRKVANVINNKSIIVQDHWIKNLHNFDIMRNNDLVGGWLITTVFFDLVIMIKKSAIFIVKNQFPLVWFVVMHINSESMNT